MSSPEVVEIAVGDRGVESDAKADGSAEADYKNVDILQLPAIQKALKPVALLRQH
eukprot:CAMPEP_0171394152 /NCGR_PEP_ID=MMETSP0880-20121228/3144_1 /TAXON_ID=67004 /ORGANISM="Thalassiosira weissflogii, Strain CCMP1336" /LENGTH=54 /DNA_ID=CAMNT_0011907455 /DNA_START=45 /DNA_END=205 /DNA_ORIENTATION=+